MLFSLIIVIWKQVDKYYALVYRTFQLLYGNDKVPCQNNIITTFAICYSMCSLVALRQVPH